MIRKFLSMCLIAIVVFSVGTAMAYDPPARDLGGQTVTMYSWDLRAPSEGHVYHDNMLATQEKFNIKVQYGRIPWELRRSARSPQRTGRGRSEGGTHS